MAQDSGLPRLRYRRRRLLKYGEDLDFLKSVKITDMDAKDIFKSIRDTNEKAKRALWEPSTVKYQWTSNADQHNKDAVEYVRCLECCYSREMTPCCLNFCMCCLLVCMKIFHPDEENSAKYQWTSNVDQHNKYAVEYVRCWDCCYSRVTTPCCLNFCMCCLLVCLKRIFHPDEEKSVKYQWTQDADEINKDYIDYVCCCKCCCSCIATPYSLVCCCFFLPAMDKCWKNKCCFLILCPLMLPMGLCICFYYHARKLSCFD